MVSSSFFSSFVVVYKSSSEFSITSKVFLRRRRLSLSLLFRYAFFFGKGGKTHAHTKTRPPARSCSFFFVSAQFFSFSFIIMDSTPQGGGLFYDSSVICTRIILLSFFVPRTQKQRTPTAFSGKKNAIQIHFISFLLHFDQKCQMSNK